LEFTLLAQLPTNSLAMLCPAVRLPAGEFEPVLSFLDRIVRGSAPKAAESNQLPYILGMTWVARTRAERNELDAVEEAIRASGLTDVVLDKIEPGPDELAFWLFTSNPKRAFKDLSELPQIAERMSTLRAAYAERSKMKFSLLWPKGRHASTPQSLGKR
jgi:hypothetical protein